ncbi:MULTISPECIES: UbiA family prenyltransferase [unclassified Streptomyces]|uniref:UbiA family prenyltransferase n=1 Tax=unclassified Streptomyces TaxID=2593676 RepID=UPI00367C8D86
MLRIVRPITCAANAAQVVLGGYLVAGANGPARAAVLLAALAMALTTAAANCVNDLRDLESDRISQPTRPLVTGALSAAGAWHVAVVCATGALLLVARSRTQLVFVLVILLLSVGYSFGVKKFGVIANAYASLVAPTPLFLGSLAVDQPHASAALGAIVLATFMFAFEIIKTLRDADGDRAAGFSTVATVLGAAATVRLFRAALGLFTVVATLPLCLTDAGWPYALLMGGGVAAPLALFVSRLPSCPNRSDILLILRTMVLCWLPGLLALGDMR